MISLPCQHGTLLGEEDFTLLSAAFIPEVERLLPFPASVEFLSRHHTGGMTATELRHLCDQGTPCRRAGQLLVPIRTGTDMEVAACIREADPLLLKKLGQQWLKRFQDDLAARLQQVRLAYTDPLTGLYNCRALELVFSDSFHHAGYSISLVRVRSSCRTAEACMQRVVTTAHFLRALTGSILFALGQDIFAFLDPEFEPAQLKKKVNRVLRALRREGMSRVHIGYSSFSDHSSPDLEQLAAIWRALAKAEKRGPYGTCDVRTLDRTELFPLPAAGPLARLRRAWRGLARYGLALLVPDDPGAWSNDFPAVVNRCLPEQTTSVAVGDNEVVVLLPDLGGEEALGRITNLGRDIMARYPERTLSAGVSIWPMLAFSKTATLRNCRKALEHARFFGRNSMVLFDHLSLNISGDRFFDEEDYQAAAREYRLGLQLKGDDINLLNSLGVVLAEMNDHGRAVHCFNQALDLDPGNFMALFNRGLCLLARGKESEALDSFARAHRISLQREKPHFDLCLQLGQLYCRSRQYSRAMEVLEGWENTPDTCNEFLLHRLLGEACMGVNRCREAMQALERSLRLYPRDGDSLSMLGLLYLREGQGDELGLSLCRRAVNIDEHNPDYVWRLGEALAGLGRYDEALAELRRVRTRWRSHAGLSLLLARIHEQTGRHHRARQVFQRVLGMRSATTGERMEAKTALQRLEQDR